jgi:hypothetical protein
LLSKTDHLSFWGPLTCFPGGSLSHDTTPELTSDNGFNSMLSYNLSERSFYNHSQESSFLGHFQEGLHLPEPSEYGKSNSFGEQAEKPFENPFQEEGKSKKENSNFCLFFIS